MRPFFQTPAQPPHTLSPTTQVFRKASRVSALALVLGLTALLPQAQALSLGRLTVQSALGEPLKAEIDIPELNAAEASSLRIGLASADVYRAAGVDFNAALVNTEITLARRPNGQAYLRIGNARLVSEPYLDLILEASWASGRIVRDYTMLFDPPNLRAPKPTLLAPTVAAVTAPTTATTPRPSAPAPAVASTPASATATPVTRNETATPSTALPPAPAPRSAARTPTPAPASSKAQPAPRPAPPQSSDSVAVKRGDTAGRIAGANKPAAATLEQMLVAMLRANPDAFLGNNVNRLKAGAVLDLPDAAQTQAVPAAQARQLIAAQSRDFNAFRQRLAAAAPSVAAQGSSRQASGSIQTEIADQRPAAVAADQLKLSKGSVAPAGAAQPEQKIAQARQTKEATDRAAELTRNITDLTKLGVTTPGQSTVEPAAPAPVPAAAAVATAPTEAATSTPAPAEPAVAAEPTPPAEPAAAPSEPTTAPTTPEPPAAPVPVAAAEPAPPAPPPAEEPGLLDAVLDNPLVVPAAGGLIALLLGLGVYRLRQRKKNMSVDSSYLESRLQPDSFFGVSGGQNIDTAEAAQTGSSLMYSPSQLDVGGDVDPVAEADVYLAYGRDLQAEEILKEAMRVTPKRVAIHTKMLEIYAKRRDIKSFEVLASEVYALTQGTGPDWGHACALGQELDPANPLYQPGGHPAQLTSAATVLQDSSPGMANTQPFDLSSFDTSQAAPEAPSAVDLDLDFSIDAPAASPTTEAPALDDKHGDNALSFDLDLHAAPDDRPTATSSAETETPSFELDSLDLSFDLPATPAAATPTPAAAATPSPSSADANGLGDLDLGLDFDLAPEPQDLAPTPPTKPTPTAPGAPAAASDGMLDFDMADMADMALDLDTLSADDSGNFDDIPDGDPLETKLSLAAEFLAIGDQEGARSLAEEVQEEATGPLKAKASAFLSNLG